MKYQARIGLPPESHDLELIELFYDHDILQWLATRMSAAKDLHAKLTLVLDAITTELGFSQAALGLIDHGSGQLRIRMAKGFADESAVLQAIGPFPLERPTWIQGIDGGKDKEFLDSIRSSSDMLAVPLFTNPSIDGCRCVGAIYATCCRQTSAIGKLNLLLRVADRVGLTIALASIAHEINNPLEAIKNSLFLMEHEPDGPDNNRRFLEIARKETERVSHTIAQKLGCRVPSEKGRMDVNLLLGETLDLVDMKFKGAGIEVIREFEENLPTIIADANQLRQAFLNLLLNAQQSIRGNGIVHVRTATVSGPRERCLTIEISDTGAGIGGETLPRIFEPLFSTRKCGSGLGLWITQSVARHHGGRIEVATVAGQGTTFRIVLPLKSRE